MKEMEQAIVRRCNVNQFDLGWLVGILEGEGCFRIASRHKKSAYPRIIVKMCDRDAVERLAEITGAGIVREAAWESKKNPKHSVAYTWTVNGAASLPLMELVRPYMGERRKQKIDEVLAEAAPTYMEVA